MSVPNRYCLKTEMETPLGYQNNIQMIFGSNSNNYQKLAGNIQCIKRESDPQWENIPPKQRKLIGNKPYYVCTPYYMIQDNPETSGVPIQPYITHSSAPIQYNNQSTACPSVSLPITYPLKQPLKLPVNQNLKQLRHPTPIKFNSKPPRSETNVPNNMLCADKEPSRLVIGRMENALGTILKKVQKKHGFIAKNIIVKNIFRKRLYNVMLGKEVGQCHQIIKEYRLKFPLKTDEDVINQAKPKKKLKNGFENCNNNSKQENSNASANNSTKTLLSDISTPKTTSLSRNMPSPNILSYDKDSALEMACRIIVRNVREEIGSLTINVVTEVRNKLRTRIHEITSGKLFKSAADVIKEYRVHYPPETDKDILKKTKGKKKKRLPVLQHFNKRTENVIKAESVTPNKEINNTLDQKPSISESEDSNELNDSMSDIFSPDLDEQITDLLASIKEEEESENEVMINIKQKSGFT